MQTGCDTLRGSSWRACLLRSDDAFEANSLRHIFDTVDDVLELLVGAEDRRIGLVPDALLEPTAGRIREAKVVLLKLHHVRDAALEHAFQ